MCKGCRAAVFRVMRDLASGILARQGHGHLANKQYARTSSRQAAPTDSAACHADAGVGLEGQQLHRRGCRVLGRSPSLGYVRLRY